MRHVWNDAWSVLHQAVPGVARPDVQPLLGWYRELSNAYEAQLALDPYRKLLKAKGQPQLEDSPSQYYLGLFRYVVDKPGDKEAALEMATRAVDRVTLKVLRGKIPDEDLGALLNVRFSTQSMFWRGSLSWLQ